MKINKSFKNLRGQIIKMKIIKKLIKKEITRQVSTFLLIGGISTVINYSLFFVFFVFFTLNYLLSAALGYISGMIFGFFYNRKYTFYSRVKIRRPLSVYVVVYFSSLFLGLFLLNFFVSNFNTNVLLTNFFLLILTTLTNFFGIKILVFKNKAW